MTCAGCAAEIGPSLLACPTCHTLVHAERLKALARDAATAAQRRDTSAELGAWREALMLLPTGSEQHTTVRARIDRLSADLMGAGLMGAGRIGAGSLGAGPLGAGPLEPNAAHADRQKPTMWAGGAITATALLVWKFKAIALILLTKGKLLLFGLTKTSTLFSMIPALGVYWAVYGWRFAAGLIASIYVHEMGHVAALTRFGIAASAPMFIPGIGAVIRSRQALTNPREEARVGLGGPIWGLGAALAAFALYRLTGAPIWAAIGHFGAWLNLFNLLPVWQLDGAHAFKAMSRTERWLMVAAIAVTFLATREGVLVLIAILAGIRAYRDEDADGDLVVSLQYAGLIAVLAWLSTFRPPASAIA